MTITVATMRFFEFELSPVWAFLVGSEVDWEHILHYKDIKDAQMQIRSFPGGTHGVDLPSPFTSPAPERSASRPPQKSAWRDSGP